MPCPFPSAQRIDLEEATARREADREVRTRRVVALWTEGLSIATIRERTGYARTFIVDVIADVEGSEEARS